MKPFTLSKHALIVFLLWAFAPLAWYLIWKDKKYHSWFPKLLWVNGIIFGILFLTSYIKVMPKLDEIYTSLHISISPYQHPLTALAIFIFALLQIVAGIKLQEKVKKHHKLVEKYLLPIIIIFVIDGILGLTTGILAAVQSPSAVLAPYLSPQIQKVDQISKTTTQIAVPSIAKPLIQTPLPSPTSSPKPMSFKEMNDLYGPCVHLPTMMFHHITSLDEAKKTGRLGLTVSTENLDSDLNYLTSHNYTILPMKSLVSFFASGQAVPSKSVVLTFDDGYDDFYTNAYPLLKKYGAHATMFLPTGLVGNPGYLTWSQIDEMNNSGLILFANHTWSHHPMNKIEAGTLDQEINVPDQTLTSHNLGNPKAFAYPYGTVGKEAETRLQSLGYTVAFTTSPGSILCKKQALVLPRVRIGNEPLNKYGF